MKTRTKAKQKVDAKTKSEVVKQEAAAPVEPGPKPKRIKVLKKDSKFRGGSAREAWYIRLKEMEGKTEGEFLANTKENPPARTQNGTVENPSGWMRFFVRNGIVSLQV